MNVVHSENDLTEYLTKAAAVSREHPVVISKFIEEAKEIEVDAVADAGEVVLYAVSEHVENAGVHSGDATIVCPAQDLDEETIQKVINTTRKIASALTVTGPFNIQFIAKNNEIKVIEVHTLFVFFNTGWYINVLLVVQFACLQIFPLCQQDIEHRFHFSCYQDHDGSPLQDP